MLFNRKTGVFEKNWFHRIIAAVFLNWGAIKL